MISVPKIRYGDNMNERKSERNLACLYCVSVVLAIATWVTADISFRYWRNNTSCAYNSACSCFLYVGETSLCHFVIFATISVLIISLTFGTYHVFKFFQRDKHTRQIRIDDRLASNFDFLCLQNRNDQAMTVRIHSIHRAVPWKSLTFLNIVVGILVLLTASIFTEGYFENCKLYRQVLIKKKPHYEELMKEQFPCSMVHHLVDHIQDKEYTSSYLNMTLCLQIALTTNWLNFIIWFLTSLYSIILTRRYNQSCKQACSSWPVQQ